MKSSFLKKIALLLGFQCLYSSVVFASDNCYCNLDFKLSDYKRFESYSYTRLGDDGSVSTPIQLPFEFRLFSKEISEFYVNINGSISDISIDQYTTVDFANYNIAGSSFMIAPYWADLHLGNNTNTTDSAAHMCGDIYYRYLVNSAKDTVGIKILWNEVGFYYGGCKCDEDRKTTFELTLTDGNGDFLPMGNNISFCYKKIGFAVGSASTCTDISGSSYENTEPGFLKGGTPATVGVVCKDADNLYYYQIGQYDRPGDTIGNRLSNGMYEKDKDSDLTTYSGYGSLLKASEKCELSYNLSSKYSLNILGCQGDGKYLASIFAVIESTNDKYKFDIDNVNSSAISGLNNNYIRLDTLLIGDGLEHKITIYKNDKIDTVFTFRAPFCSCPENVRITVDGVSVNNSISICKNSLINLGVESQLFSGSQQCVWEFESQEGVKTEITPESFKVMSSGSLSVLVTSDNCKTGVKVGIDLQVDICAETGCNDCPSRFAPEPGEKYVVGGWVSVPSQLDRSSFEDVYIEIRYSDGTSVQCMPEGNIIDGWQRISQTIEIPKGAKGMTIALKNTSDASAYFDDIRFLPVNASMKSYVYDPETLRLTAELDEQNYATFYDYDEEGALVRVRKETERGVMTIREARQSKPKRD